jgi:hypothetical protein
MLDVVSINRQFLTMARQAAQSPSGEIVTGLARPILDQLSRLTLDQIDAIARAASVSLISLRLTEAELQRLITLKNGRQMAYALAVVSSRVGH